MNHSMAAETYIWTCHNCGSRDELTAAGGNVSCLCGPDHEIVMTVLGTLKSAEL